jgi:hypothetical protein
VFDIASELLQTGHAKESALGRCCRQPTGIGPSNRPEQRDSII